MGDGKRRRRLAVGIGLVLPALIVTLPFLLSSDCLSGSDFYAHYWSHAQFAQSSFQQGGELPRWNPYQFAGTPFLGDVETNMLYPPNWLFLILAPEDAFEILIAVHLLLCLWGMYRLTRFFRWEPGGIRFVALRGLHGPFGFPPEDVIHEHEYLHNPGVSHLVPTRGRERFRVNLWMNNAGAGGTPPPTPAGGQSVEVIIPDFRFVSLPQPVPGLAPAGYGLLALLVAALASASLWRKLADQ